MTRHVVLVGLPGAGKTAVGRALAARLGRSFLDFDEEIVRREGRSVAEIFAAEGEAYFRDLERGLTAEVAGMEPAVLSPGGGWIVQPGLAESLRGVATLVHLKATPATALARMGEDAALRPLLSGPDRMGRVEQLWAERKERYQLAKVEIDTEILDVDEVAALLERLIVRSGA